MLQFSCQTLGLLILTFKYTSAQCPMSQYRHADATNNDGRGTDRRGAINTDFHPVSQSMRPPMLDQVDVISPRFISETIFQQSKDTFDENYLNHMVMQWGQFIDHDITESHVDEEYQSDIQCAADDPIFPNQRMKFHRITGLRGEGMKGNKNAITHYIDASNIYGSDGGQQTSLRATINGKSHYLLKMTYGEFYGYNVTDYPLLPTRCESGSEVFYSGDARTMEQPGLTALHTLFAREHNRLARLAKVDLYPGVMDIDMSPTDLNKVFEEARLVVESEMQKITFEDWLPSLTGRKLKIDSSEPESSLDCSKVQPNILTVFSGALFRFGHSMVNEVFWRFQVRPTKAKQSNKKTQKRDLLADIKDKAPKHVLVEEGGGDGGGGFENKGKFKAHRKGHLKLSGEWRGKYRPAFFDAVNVFLQTEMDIDPLLSGLLLQPNQKVDTQIVPSLRQHLFRQNSRKSQGNSKGSACTSVNGEQCCAPTPVTPVDDTYTTAFDLVAMNIQRGRDLGISNYVHVREALTGMTVTQWHQITTSPTIQAQLQKVYESVDKIDLFVGMLAEDHMPGASVGITLRTGLELQFSRLQRGDCLWYTRRLADDIKKLDCTVALHAEKVAVLSGKRSLADIIAMNTKLPFSGYNSFRTYLGQTKAPPVQDAPGDAGDASTVYEPYHPQNILFNK